MNRASALMLLVFSTAGCLRTAEERALEDELVGVAEADGLHVSVAGGLAAVRAIDAGALSLWASAPALDIRLISAADVPAFKLIIDNCMPASELAAATIGGAFLAAFAAPPRRPTLCAWTLALPAGVSDLHVAPPDADRPGNWRFAVVNDAHGAAQLADFFPRLAQDRELRFLLSAGDFTEEGGRTSLEELQRRLADLPIPFYATIGNHELGIFGSAAEGWHELFGRHSSHFHFRSVAFTLVDSAGGSIDPIVYDELGGWLAGGEPQVFITHYPPLDPDGLRNGSFRGRSEAAKLLARLAGAGVDLCLYGHIHAYMAFANAGIQAFVSGGGEPAVPALGGIGRHHLSIEVDAGGRFAVHPVLFREPAE